MKNKLFLSVLILCAAALFSSCLSLMAAALEKDETYKITLDENTPAEKCATVTFKGSFILKKWNGADMKAAMYNRKERIWSNDNIVLTVPAGDNNFTFDVFYIDDSMFSTSYYRIPNAEFSFSLEAGKKYEIKSRSKSPGTNKGTYFIGLYDVTKKSTLITEKTIGDN